MFGDDRYATAAAVNTFTTRGALVAGSAVGGLLVTTLGAREALLIDAVTFAASAVLVRVSVAYRPAGRDTHSGEAAPGWAADLAAGVRLVFGDRRLRTLTLYAWLAAFHVAPLGVVVLRTSGRRWIVDCTGCLLRAPGAGLAPWAWF